MEINENSISDNMGKYLPVVSTLKFDHSILKKTVVRQFAEFIFRNYLIPKDILIFCKLRKFNFVFE